MPGNHVCTQVLSGLHPVSSMRQARPAKADEYGFVPKGFLANFLQKQQARIVHVILVGTVRCS